MVTRVTASTRGASALVLVFAVASVVVFVLAGGAACSSFTAADGDDAGPASGGANDASAEGAASDAPSESDVTVSGDDFCAVHHADPGFVYCNDFEQATSMPWGFSDVMNTPSVTSIEVKSDGLRHAVLEVAVASSAAGSHTINLGQLIGVGSDSMLPFVAELDIKIVSESEPSITAAAIHVAGTKCEGSFGLGVFDGATVGGTRNRTPTPQPYIANEWQHLTISVLKTDTSKTGYREVTTYGGKTLVDREALSSSGGDPTACTRSDLQLGVNDTEQDAATIKLLFDNVLVRTPP